MKEKLVISTRDFVNATRFGQLFYIGENLSTDPDYACFLDGYVIDNSFEKKNIISVFKEKGIEGFNNLSGQFNIIVYCRTENKLFFTNDFFAPLSLYYYNENNLFVLSNSFWQVVDVIKPQEKDLNKEIIAQMAIYGLLLDKETFIRGLMVMDTASNYEYSLSTGILKSTKYDDYSSFTEEPMTLEEATDRFQESIVEAINYVKHTHTNERIGISVSGGLDSRIVPSFFGKDADYFVITGPHKVKPWFKPYNFTYIDQIAKAYGIDIKKINQADTLYEEKLFLEVKNAPMRGEDICKVISKDQVDFDILLTSGSPDLLSSALTMYRDGWSMYDIMEKYQGRRYIKRNRQRTIKSILKFLFVDKPNTFQVYNLEYIDFFPIKIMDKNDFYKRAHERIDAYTRMKENPKDAIMIENYDLVATDSSLGAFESLSGQVKIAYTYFYPWAYKVLKHVPFEFINQRLILKRLIEKYYPQVANIASEHSIHGIHNEKRTSFLWILKSLIQKLLGGSSYASGFFEVQKQKALDLFDQESTWYDSIFDGASVRKTIDLQSDIFTGHLKIKTILRAIEKGDWKKYLD